MLAWIADVMRARRARRHGRLQTLWGGYGEVFRVSLDGGIAPTAIVKHVQPPASARATPSDERKRRSYAVEQAFYRDFAPRCDDACRVARCYGSRADDGEWLLVLEDLDAAGYPRRHDAVAGAALDRCLAWLAAFHTRYLAEPGATLWPRGTYWHLATRMDELAQVRDPALRARAPELAAQLAGATYQTLVHGDAKEANFCFARDDRAVAAVDFQYVGRGVGVQDVAYLLWDRADHAAWLDVYFRHLAANAALEAEWRALYPVARDDFARFLAGWRPTTAR